MIAPDPRTAPTPSAPETATARAETREVKVKLPVEQILRLHYTRMKQRENFSAIVSSALSRYFDDLTSP